METEKVVSELNKRLAQRLPPYYKRRVIFWLDEDREYADKLEDFELENAKLVQLTGNNIFTVKKLLGHDDVSCEAMERKMLLYPCSEIVFEPNAATAPGK